jgi:hypothetical protein
MGVNPKIVIDILIPVPYILTMIIWRRRRRRKRRERMAGFKSLRGY